MSDCHQKYFVVCICPWGRNKQLSFTCPVVMSDDYWVRWTHSTTNRCKTVEIWTQKMYRRIKQFARMNRKSKDDRSRSQTTCRETLSRAWPLLDFDEIKVVMFKRYFGSYWLQFWKHYRKYSGMAVVRFCGRRKRVCQGKITECRKFFTMGPG